MSKLFSSKLLSFVFLLLCLVVPAPVVIGTNVNDAADPTGKFAEDVLLHVVLHEMGHALVREFDLPVLANEETLADAFATHYLLHHLPDRAADVITARVRSLMFEANEVARNEWTVEGEHNNDARRAYQIVAMAIAVDAETYSPLAGEIGMSSNAIDNARDYGTEIHRSWRRILQPLMMHEGQTSNETRVRVDEGSNYAAALNDGALAAEIQSALEKFDWHSRVSVFFSEGEGGAGWSRSSRTITVRDGYVQRFVEQDRQIKNAGR